MVVLELAAMASKHAKGHSTFTSAELTKIRKLLAEKQRAGRGRQKSLRQQIRNLGFYISDFAANSNGFGPKDLDRLVKTGRIRVTDGSSPATGPGIWERFRAWLIELFSGKTEPELTRTTTRGKGGPSPKSGRLEPLLAPNLDVVFVGTEPGPTSARQGDYYANPANTFYADLYAAGFTPRQLRPQQYRVLLSNGIGLDDLYGDPGALRRRLEEAAPRAICFNSKGALERFAGHDISDWAGTAAGSHVRLGSAIIWAVPDSSPRAYRHQERRVRLLRQLHERLR